MSETEVTEAATTEIVTPEATEAAPSWWIAEGMPGQGDKPDWLSSKFKTVADMAKSYGELEKRVGTAPDDYDLSKAPWIDPDYAPFQEMKEFAKSKRVPQEVMDKVLESMDKYMNEFTIDYSEERAKLGDNASMRITVLDNWAKANLSKDSYSALTENLKTAESIKALEELRGKMMEGNTTIPSGNESAVTNAPSMADIQSELTNNLTKYKTDTVYRRDLQARMELASKNSGYVDKQG